MRVLIVLFLLLAPGCRPRATEGRSPAAPPSELPPAGRQPHEDPIPAGLQAARKKAAEGDEAGAIAAFDALLTTVDTLDPRRTDIACELGVFFNNRAQRLFEKEPRVGLAEMRRARALCPGSAQVVQNLATMLFVLARLEDRETSDGRRRGIELLRESLSLHDAQGYGHAFIGDLFVQENDVSTALRHMRRAVELLPNEPSLALRLAELERTANVEGGFRNTRHDHFIARFEGYAQERLAWTALDVLERAYFFVGSKLNIYPREPITVVIYTGDQYKQVTNLPDWAAGSFDGKIRIREGHLLDAEDRLEAVLRHEYTHAVLATLPVQVPAWFNEGLAKHFEGEDVDAASRWLQQHGPGGAAPWAVLELPSFTVISEPHEARVAYATSSVLVHTLLEKRGRAALQGLLSRLARAEAFSAAFRDAYAMDARQHYDAWVESL